MSETFVEEVEQELADKRMAHRSALSVATMATFRIALLIIVFVCVAVGLWVNGVLHAELFGAATVASLIWLRGKKSI